MKRRIGTIFFIGSTCIFFVFFPKRKTRLTCDEIGNLEVLTNIRNDPSSKNKIVQRVRHNDEIYILKTVRKESEWLLEQANNEIKFLEIFEGEENFPKLILKCPSDKILSYLVEEIDGNALCDDYFGTDENCVALTTMKERLKNSVHQLEFNLWRFISSFINLLTQIKVKNLWIEDLSGSNFIVTNDFQVYLIDLDSIKPLEKESRKCKSHQECLEDFDERLWVPNSLNHKISWNCRETNNRCRKNECLSLSKLTECEFGNWILKSLSYGMPEIENHSKLSFLRDCLIKNDPKQRCSFTLAKTFVSIFDS